jgi:hypothetical protein
MHTETKNMMKRNAIALAVAALCGAPLTAAAAGHWEVMTPSSVSESAPQLLAGPHLPPADAVTTVANADASTPVAYTEAVTAPAVEDSGRTVRAVSQRQRSATRSHVAHGGGMANPQTPYSPNESGEQRYTEEMQAYQQHLASVEQARIATAESYAPAPAVAQLETAPVDKDTAGEVDRLLAAPTNPPADRERESVATVTPALVDSRTSPGNELRVEGATTGEPAHGVGAATGEAARDAGAPTSEQAGQTSTATEGAMSTPAGAAMSMPAEGATSTLIEGATSTPTEGATTTIAAAPAPAPAPAAATVEGTPIAAVPTAQPEVAAVPAPIPPVGATATSGATAETQGTGPAQ